MFLIHHFISNPLRRLNPGVSLSPQHRSSTHLYNSPCPSLSPISTGPPRSPEVGIWWCQPCSQVSHSFQIECTTSGTHRRFFHPLTPTHTSSALGALPLRHLTPRSHRGAAALDTHILDSHDLALCRSLGLRRECSRQKRPPHGRDSPWRHHPQDGTGFRREDLRVWGPPAPRQSSASPRSLPTAPRGPSGPPCTAQPSVPACWGAVALAVWLRVSQDGLQRVGSSNLSRGRNREAAQLGTLSLPLVGNMSLCRCCIWLNRDELQPSRRRGKPFAFPVVPPQRFLLGWSDFRIPTEHRRARRPPQT